jgi:hypothetical protein
MVIVAQTGAHRLILRPTTATSNDSAKEMDTGLASRRTDSTTSQRHQRQG